MYYKYEVPSILDGVKTQSDVMSFSYSELTKDPSLMHSHANTEIIIPLNNNGLLCCDNQTVKMNKFCVYVLPPNISHTEKNVDTDRHFNYYVLMLKNTVIKSSKTDKCYIELNLGNIFDELCSYLNNARAHLMTNTRHDQTLAILNLSCFHRLFTEWINNTELSVQTQITKQKASFTQEVEHFLLANYSQDIKISDIACKYNVSERLLNLKFKKDLGVSPKQFLTQQRINTAKGHLLNTDYTISQISMMCGFSSPAYFTFYFKKALGKTPKEFRRG